MPKQRIVSVDVFDTCLSRISSLPSSVYYLMAARCLGNSDRHLLYEFVNARMRAEKKARILAEANGREDVLIGEIYDVFDFNVPGYSSEMLQALEFEVENQVLRPIRAMYGVINAARRNGHRVVFISDNYLPASFIREQLKKYGFIEDGDPLYVSGEVGLTKTTGHLFDHVKEAEKVEFSDITHYGDNLIADLRSPKVRGIKCHLVETGMSRYEFAWNNTAYASNHPLDIYLMSGIARSLRIANKECQHSSMVLNTIAPLFVPFVSWILRDARQRGIRKLYFLARDGYILHEIAKELSVNYPEIELSYLYGSRRAFYSAGMKDCSRDEFRWVLSEAVRKTPRQMMLRLNADADMLQDAMAALEMDSSFLDQRMDAVMYEQFLDVLTHPLCAGKFQLHIDQQRALVRDYFKQEGLLDGQKCGVVDIGWSRFCLHSMNAILGEHQAFGYFFALLRERVNVQQLADSTAVFYPEEFFQDNCNKDLLQDEVLMILEQFFAISGQQSTIGFERDGDRIKPVFEKKKPGRKDFSGYVDLHVRIVRMFAEEYAKLEPLVNDPETLIRNCGYTSIKVMMTDPTMEEARLLADFNVDNGVNDEIPLVRKLGPLRMMKIVSEALRDVERNPLYVWTEGSLVYSWGDLGLRLLKTGRVLKEYFSRGRFRKPIEENS